MEKIIESKQGESLVLENKREYKKTIYRNYGCAMNFRIVKL
jgi:hypothetical protein